MVDSIVKQHGNDPQWFLTYSCMALLDGFFWQINAMVMVILIYVIFRKYGCIENAVLGNLWWVLSIKFTRIMASIHTIYPLEEWIAKDPDDFCNICNII